MSYKVLKLIKFVEPTRESALRTFDFKNLINWSGSD